MLWESVSRFDGLERIGAIPSYKCTSYGADHYFHGFPFVEVDTASFSDHVLAIDELERHGFTVDEALYFSVKIRMRSLPSKGWERGSPYRRLILISRKCNAVIHAAEMERKKKAREERRERMAEADLRARASRANRKARSVMRDVQIAGLNIKATH